MGQVVYMVEWKQSHPGSVLRERPPEWLWLFPAFWPWLMLAGWERP